MTTRKVGSSKIPTEIHNICQQEMYFSVQAAALFLNMVTTAVLVIAQLCKLLEDFSIATFPVTPQAFFKTSNHRIDTCAWRAMEFTKALLSSVPPTEYSIAHLQLEAQMCRKCTTQI